MHGTIERGIVKSVADGQYTVASLDRDGITTPPLATLDESEYLAGDKVIYFIFPDGTGRILCKL